MLDLNIQFLPVEKQLKPYVRRVIFTEGYNLENKIIPIASTGYCYLTFSKSDIELCYSNRIIKSDAQLFLAGLLERETPHFKINGNMFQIGVEMTPLAFYYFFGIKGSDIIDNVMPLKEVLKGKYKEQYFESFKNSDRADWVSQQLQLLLQDKLNSFENTYSELETAMEIIYHKHGNVVVSDIVQQLDLKERSFRRNFKEIIGLSPKQYCKIIQLNAAFEAIQSGNEANIYEKALECGYFDHAHFINVFKEHIGVSPQAFLNSDYDFLKQYLGVYSG